MAIVASDLLMKFSTTAGSAGNSGSGTAIGSLGKYSSTTTWAGTTLNDLFPDITATDNSNSVVDYRCVFLLNNHATLSLSNTFLWLSAQVSGGADIAIGLDAAGANPKGDSTAQAVTIANINTAPSGVTFSAPTSKGAGLNMGTIAAGYVYGVWIRRTATNSAALSNDGATIQVEGDSPP